MPEMISKKMSNDCKKDQKCRCTSKKVGKYRAELFYKINGNGMIRVWKRGHKELGYVRKISEDKKWHLETEIVFLTDEDAKDRYRELKNVDSLKTLSSHVW